MQCELTERTRRDDAPGRVLRALSSLLGAMVSVPAASAGCAMYFAIAIPGPAGLRRETWMTEDSVDQAACQPPDCGAWPGASACLPLTPEIRAQMQVCLL